MIFSFFLPYIIYVLLFSLQCRRIAPERKTT
nr:MAG TPA: hypothetical protein [Bacteriophage sp.]